MSDENTNKSPVSGAKTDPKLIKKLESDLKTAFKENRFDDLKKIADELKNSDPENRIAERIVGKMNSAKAEILKVANAGKIKIFEEHMRDAFKAGRLMDLAKIAGEIKKLDPENRAVKKIEIRIEKAKANLDAQVKKEKIRGLEFAIKAYLKEKKLDEAVKKANELLLLDKDNGMALKALKIVGKTKNIDYKNLMAPVSADANAKPAESPKISVNSEKKPEAAAPLAKKEEVLKPGFFSRLFKKKEVKSEDKAKEIKAVAADQPRPAILSIKAPESKSAIVTPKTVIAATQAPKVAAKTENKPSFFAKLFKKSDEKSQEQTTSKVAAALPEKKAEVKNPAIIMPAVKSVKNETGAKEPGLIARLFKKKELKPEPAKSEISKKEALSKAVTAIMGAEQVKSAILPVKADAVVKPPVAEVSKDVSPVAPVIQPAKPVAFKPIIPAKAPVTAFKPQAEIKSEPKPQEPESIVKVPLDQIQNPPQAAKPSVPAEAQNGKGNIFTKLFGKKVETEKPTESIIETIVAQSGQSAKIKREARKKEDDTDESLLRFSSVFLKFATGFVIISAVFFYTYNIDANNTVFSLLGQQNYAIQLKNAAMELDEKKAEKESLDKEIDKYKKGYQNDYKSVIDKIVANRMDWADLIERLNEVTESVYEKNALAQYVQYNNYSYDAETGRLTVNATLSDPLGKNLTKLAELEEAFRYYPKDKDDSNDKTKPYFYELQGFQSYAKTFNKATGRYVSSFSLSLSTKPLVKK